MMSMEVEDQGLIRVSLTIKLRHLTSTHMDKSSNLHNKLLI